VTPAPTSIDGARVLILAGDLFAVEDFAVAFEAAGADLAVQVGLIDPYLASLAQVVVVHESLTGTTLRNDLVAFLDELRQSVVTLGAGITIGFQGLRFTHVAVGPDQALDTISEALAPVAEPEPAETAAEVKPAERVESEPAGLATYETLEVEAAAPSADGESAGRTLRMTVTVLVVTALLWLLFGRGGAFSRLRGPTEGVVPGTPPAGASSGVPGAPASNPSTSGATGSPASGGIGAPSAPVPAVPSAAELAGRVLRADTNGSIGGATVVATGPSGAVATITDGQGRWRFTGLKGGTYTVISTVPRFAAKQVQVELPEGQTVENVNLSLDPEGA
jgi:hypothetical protein